MNENAITLEEVKKKVLLALSNIEDPDLKNDIVSLGFVKNLTISSQIPNCVVSFAIELTTPACPVKDAFKKQATNLVMAIEEVSAVNIEMTAQLKKEVDLHIDSPLKNVDSIVAVASCKGGVGKSTVSAILATELAHRGFRVGLLDIDIFGPSLPTLFGLPAHGVQQKNGQMMPLEIAVRNEEKNITTNLKLMSFGFLLGDAAAVMRGPMVSNYLQQIFKLVNWGDLDYLFIDLPPGTGDVQLTLTQKIRLNGAVMVTTKAALALDDVARGIKMFEKVNVPLYGLVDNMAYFKCNNCNTKHYIFSSEKKVALSQKLGLPVLAELPIISEKDFNFKNYITNSSFSNLVDELVKKIGTQKHSPQKKVKVEFDEKEVSIKLADEDALPLVFSNKLLRLRCPCAFCVNEYSGERKIKIEDISQDIHVKSAAPLGNYAISLHWSDGHSSGIYSFEYLRMLKKEIEKS